MTTYFEEICTCLNPNHIWVFPIHTQFLILSNFTLDAYRITRCTFRGGSPRQAPVSRRRGATKGISIWPWWAEQRRKLHTTVRLFYPYYYGLSRIFELGRRPVCVFFGFSRLYLLSSPKKQEFHFVVIVNFQFTFLSFRKRIEE